LYEEAHAQVLAALEATDGKPLFRFYLCAILFAMGRSKEALLQLEQGMAEAPRLVKELVALNHAILQNQQVVDVVAKYKKGKRI
jgi:hypothetical protein